MCNSPAFSVFFSATLLLFVVLSFVQKDVAFCIVCPECLGDFGNRVVPSGKIGGCSLFVSWYVLKPFQLYLIFHGHWDYLSRIFQTDIMLR